MIFASIGHIWLVFYLVQHPFIALATLGIVGVCTGLAKWRDWFDAEDDSPHDDPQAFAVYLQHREEMHHAEEKARELKERLALADIQGEVQVVLTPGGHSKLDIRLKKLSDKPLAYQIADQLTRS